MDRDRERLALRELHGRRARPARGALVSGRVRIATHFVMLFGLRFASVIGAAWLARGGWRRGSRRAV